MPVSICRHRTSVFLGSGRSYPPAFSRVAPLCAEFFRREAKLPAASRPAGSLFLQRRPERTDNCECTRAKSSVQGKSHEESWSSRRSFCSAVAVEEKRGLPRIGK